MLWGTMLLNCHAYFENYVEENAEAEKSRIVGKTIAFQDYSQSCQELGNKNLAERTWQYLHSSQ